MRKDTLEYVVNNAIDTLKLLAAHGFKVEDDSDTSWKSKFLELEDLIRDHLHNAESLYEDMKANGLTLGTAEAEGFLRGARYLNNCLNDIMDERTEN